MQKNKVMFKGLIRKSDNGQTTVVSNSEYGPGHVRIYTDPMRSIDLPMDHLKEMLAELGKFYESLKEEN